MRGWVSAPLSLMLTCSDATPPPLTPDFYPVARPSNPAADELFDAPSLEGVGIIAIKSTTDDPRDDWAADVSIQLEQLPGNTYCHATFDDVGYTFVPEENQALTGCEGCIYYFAVTRTLSSHNGLCVWQVGAEQLRIAVDLENNLIRLDSEGQFVRRYVIDDTETITDILGYQSLIIHFSGDSFAGFAE